MGQVEIRKLQCRDGSVADAGYEKVHLVVNSGSSASGSPCHVRSDFDTSGCTILACTTAQKGRVVVRRQTKKAKLPLWLGSLWPSVDGKLGR